MSYSTRPSAGVRFTTIQGEVRDYVDTMLPGWLQEAFWVLLDGDDVWLYDWPSRRGWIRLRSAWFHPTEPLLPALERLLRGIGIVAGRGGRCR
jgi:hypothetical protein